MVYIKPREHGSKEELDTSKHYHSYRHLPAFVTKPAIV